MCFCNERGEVRLEHKGNRASALICRLAELRSGTQTTPRPVQRQDWEGAGTCQGHAVLQERAELLHGHGEVGNILMRCLCFRPQYMIYALVR